MSNHERECIKINAMNAPEFDLAIQVHIVVEEGGTLPEYKTPGSAGMDITCTDSFSLAPMERKLVSTGLRVAVPPGFEAQARPRSGLAVKHGISMVNSPGTIDSDYRGVIKVCLINLGSDVVDFVRGERIGQVVFCPVARATFVVVDSLDETTRGEGGFGSTGS